MSKVAVIVNDDGTIGILHPGKNTELTFEEICEKDIPDGGDIDSETGFVSEL